MIEGQNIVPTKFKEIGNEFDFFYKPPVSQMGRQKNTVEDMDA